MTPWAPSLHLMMLLLFLSLAIRATWGDAKYAVLTGGLIAGIQLGMIISSYMNGAR